ncbi:hypothetical protein AVEN_74824-1 [Araneus ventricosus]|uniref:Uncharacterized protein n=1 Tax=Araneus ventricosus TaxID=182803 RepID=A0A4Y2HNY2_ARAVE|nr:hypothetical protein AVEN_74824-1 [Araneus ventricosus]
MAIGSLSVTACCPVGEKLRVSSARSFTVSDGRCGNLDIKESDNLNTVLKSYVNSRNTQFFVRIRRWNKALFPLSVVRRSLSEVRLNFRSGTAKNRCCSCVLGAGLPFRRNVSKRFDIHQIISKESGLNLTI